MGIRDWELGIGNWGKVQIYDDISIPSPQSPVPSTQYPVPSPKVDLAALKHQGVALIA
ncbi:hypothetical protein JYQ62_32270 [Nostoc sp. UHCC 0702]|nr:hypothetical protein JYQ62_32270 [Nostoc sp. UHCC 0702]